MFAPVPYEITVELNIITTNTTDALQVIEQIIPYFTPTLTVSANLSTFGSTAAPTNIPITLNSIDFSDNYADNFQDSTREIIYTLRFSIATYIYGKIDDNSGQVIKSVYVDINSTPTGNNYSKYFNNVSATGQINEGKWSI